MMCFLVGTAAFVFLSLSFLTLASNTPYPKPLFSTGPKNDVPHSQETLLDSITRGDWIAVDPQLPSILASLQERGSHRCWHKHSTFHEHLLSVHNILRIWNQDRRTCRVGLLHSAYSNSYVNLALYNITTDREIMREMIGEEAEEIVHLFCVIDRQQVVVNTLLRQGFIPAEGLQVPHLKNPNETVFLPEHILRLLVVFTMADIAEQYFGWQDELFGGGGDAGSMIIPHRDYVENHRVKALWPGEAKPGLWMNYLSQLGQLLHSSTDCSSSVVPPPIFDNCSKTLTVSDEKKARDLYWSVITGEVSEVPETVIATLLESHRLNPYAYEPLLLLAQTSLHQNDFDAAAKYARKALQLAHMWGTPYDKRWSLAASVAWGRVLEQRALDRLPWPGTAWEMNNLGLVR